MKTRVKRFQEGDWKLPGIRQQEVVPVVLGALGAVSKRLDTWLSKLGITIRKGLLQKTAL